MRVYGNQEYKLWLSDSNGVDVVRMRPESNLWVGTIYGQEVEVSIGKIVDLEEFMPDDDGRNASAE